MIDAILRFMAASDPLSGPVNLVNPEEVTVRQLAELVIELTGSSSRLVHPSLPQDDPPQRCPDIGLARRWLEWQPTVSLRDELRRTIDHHRQMAALSGRP
jgi:UDP-glucuronate decarboxylase